MSTNKPKPRNVLSPYVGFRSKEISQRLHDVIDQNRGKVNMSQILRAAIEEKLDRIERGEEEGIRLSPRAANPAGEMVGEAKAAARQKSASTNRSPRT